MDMETADLIFGKAVAITRFKRLMFHVLFRAIDTHSVEELRKKAGLSKRTTARIILGRVELVSLDDIAAWLWACGYELELKMVPFHDDRKGDPLPERIVRSEEALLNKN